MPKKLGLSAVLALVVVVVLGTFAQAGATQKASVGSSDKEKRIELVAHTLKTADIDVGDEGPSLGDYFVFYDELREKGKKVGNDGGSCTVVYIKYKGKKPTEFTVQCVVTASLRKGQITSQGLVTFPAEGNGDESFVVAITGGTGAYRTAHGEIEVTPVDEEEAELVVKLILSDKG